MENKILEILKQELKRAEECPYFLTVEIQHGHIQGVKKCIALVESAIKRKEVIDLVKEEVNEK